MEILENVVVILQIISSIIIMILVLLQSDNESGNIVTGPVEKSGAGMGRDARLAKATAYVGTAFVVLTIAASTLMLI